MNCMKCGREIAEGQVFCGSCLEIMEKYPVKPGIAIQLPSQRHSPGPKKTHTKRKQGPTPEEQIAKLKKRLRTAITAWLITLLLLAAAAYPAMEYLLGHMPELPGQNYSTVTNTTQP